jgi:hypothetical protein
MFAIRFSRIILLLVIATLPGCGGGAGGGIASAASPSGGGIGGTGVTSSGTIDGFGSIFVNGVEFNTEGAEILIDGEPAGEEALGLGMVVLVSGTIDDNGTIGTAAQVIFDQEVEGPVEAIERDQDGDSMLVTVIGVSVIAERTGTVFQGVDFDTLAVGDLIEVSGFPNGEGELRATRIEKEGEFIPGVSEIEVEGIVSLLTETEFTLDEFIVDYSNADLSGVSGSTLREGMLVEVYGTLDTGRILASRIEQSNNVEDAIDDGEQLSVQGTITNFSSVGNFQVSGVAVDASAATLLPMGLELGNGAIVEAQGSWDGSVLQARVVEARRGRIEIEARVAAVDAAANSVTLQLVGGTVPVQLDSRTLLEDDTGAAETITIDDIRTGDFLEVEAIMADNALVATRIDREEVDDDVVQAPVESFMAGSSLTVLGVTYSTEGAEFEDSDDRPLAPEQFYGALQVGMLVKIKDELPTDGIADEVEFESDAELDGEREFEDDNEPEEPDEPNEPE